VLYACWHCCVVARFVVARWLGLEQVGTGSGPTKEFYAQACQEALCTPGVWRHTSEKALPGPSVEENPASLVTVDVARCSVYVVSACCPFLCGHGVCSAYGPAHLCGIAVYVWYKPVRCFATTLDVPGFSNQSVCGKCSQAVDHSWCVILACGASPHGACANRAELVCCCAVPAGPCLCRT